MPGIFGLIENGDFVKTYGFRKPLNTLSQNIRFFIFRDKLFNDAYTADHYWWDYLENRSIDDFQNTIPFSEADLEDLQRRLDHVSQLLQKKGVKLYVLVAPNKATIYPEHLIQDFPKISTESRLDQLIDYQTHHGVVKVVDVRQVLIAERKNHNLFLKTDTHWNTFGAFFGYRTLFEIIARDFPVLQAHELSSFEFVSHEGKGDLSEMAGSLAVREEIAIQKLIDGPIISFENENLDIQSSSTWTDLPRAVIFRDSFFSMLVNYVTPHFSETEIKWTNMFDESLIDSMKPDIVIMEYAERYIDAIKRLPNPDE